MPEHTPAPTPHRAIYGFAFYLLFLTLFILYALWAFLPTKRLGLTYLPDQYFALFVPMLVLFGLACFIFFIYPAINMSMTPNVDELSSIVDVHLVRRHARDTGVDVASSWEHIRCAIEASRTTNAEGRSSVIENCQFCQQTHLPVHTKPIETAQFMDLKEMNRSLFD